MNIYLHAHWLLFQNLMTSWICSGLKNLVKVIFFPRKKRYSYAPREFRHVSVWVFTRETQSNYLTVVRWSMGKIRWLKLLTTMAKYHLCNNILLMNIHLHAHWLLFQNLMTSWICSGLKNLVEVIFFPRKKGTRMHQRNFVTFPCGYLRERPKAITWRWFVDQWEKYGV